MQPGRRRRRFYAITAVVFVAIIATAIGIVVYFDYSYVNVEFTGNTNTAFILVYDNSNVTLPTSENATVAVLPHANVTITATVNPQYTISGWIVTGANYHSGANNSIDFLTGSGGSTIQVSVELTRNPSAG